MAEIFHASKQQKLVGCYLVSWFRVKAQALIWSNHFQSTKNFYIVPKRFRHFYFSTAVLMYARQQCNFYLRLKIICYDSKGLFLKQGQKPKDTVLCPVDTCDRIGETENPIHSPFVIYTSLFTGAQKYHDTLANWDYGEYNKT